MAINQATPYLFFNGSAERAAQLYERALGAKTEGLMRWEDMPGASGDSGPCQPQNRRRIMHGALRLGEATVFFSDVLDEGQPSGDNVQVCLDFDDAEDMARKFDALAVGGTVDMPIEDAFWGAKFGSLTDEFGIRWMFVCDQSNASG